MQPQEIIPKDPNTIYFIIIAALFVSEKVFNMTIKGVQALRGRSNGNGKDKEKDKGYCLAGLLQSQSWDDHKNATRDTKLAVGRNEGSLSILKRESLLQTTELKSQTTELKSIGKTLIEIAKNGSK